MSLRAEEVRPLLQTRVIGHGEYRLAEEMASTNAVAKEMAKAGVPDGSIAVCEYQSRGRGRMTRTWDARPGEDLTQSVIHRLKNTELAPLIPLAAALAVYHAIGKEVGNVGIKWPNDVLIGEKKVCGILCELCGNAAVIGVGINVNRTAFPEELRDKASSLLLSTGKKWDRAALFAAYLNELEKWLDLLENQGKDALLEQYRPLCITLGKQVQVLEANATWIGEAITVDENGCLVVRNEAGDPITVRAGDVSVRGLMGYADVRQEKI